MREREFRSGVKTWRMEVWTGKGRAGQGDSDGVVWDVWKYCKRVWLKLVASKSNKCQILRQVEKDNNISTHTPPPYNQTNMANISFLRITFWVLQIPFLHLSAPLLFFPLTNSCDTHFGLNSTSFSLSFFFFFFFPLKKTKYFHHLFHHSLVGSSILKNFKADWKSEQYERYW